MINNKKKDNNHLKVSVLMNCYNGEKYLHESIQSVIDQTYKDWELIFWDNQSNDKSKAIFDSFKDSRLKYFMSDEHTDLGGARSKAFRHLTGSFIAVLDTDDIWLPDKLEKQLQLFNNPEVGIVISDTLFFNESNERALYNGKYPPEGYVFKDLLKKYYVSLETIMIRKSVINNLDYAFDSDFSYIADFDLVLRVAKISKLAICREVLAKWRVHEDSDSWISSESFCYERERWINKQVDQDPSFLKHYSKEVSILSSKNFLLLAIYSLGKNERIKALRFISKTKFKDWYDYIVLLLCFVPFSNRLIVLMQKRRIQNLLR